MKKTILNDSEMIQLIAAYDDNCRSDERGPILHWTDIEECGQKVCVVECPRFCEYKVYAADDIPAIFEREYAEDVMSAENWNSFVRKSFEDGGVDSSLIDKYETYLAQEKDGEKPNGPGKPNACPVCGSADLEYGISEVLDEGISYPWICNSCGSCGKECYDFVFSEHIIDIKATAEAN